MKKTLLGIIAILFTTIISAQITRGSIFIGGQISGGMSEYSGQKQKHFFFTPAIGTAVKQNLFLGIDLTYGKTKYETNSNLVSEGASYGAGFFVRQYLPIAKRFYFFVQGRADYSYGKSESLSGSPRSENKSNFTSLALYPGVSFALTRVLHIETGFNNLAFISYSSSTTKQTGFPDQRSSNFNFNTSVSASNMVFALRFIIPKK